MNKRTLLAMTAAGLMAAAPALAQVNATAATDLNLRAGPGGDQQIVGVIPSGGEVTVDGCLDAANWCQVTFDGTQGWAYGDYLSATMPDQPEPVVVYADRQALQIPVISVENATPTSSDSAEADPGAGAGAVAGAAAAATLVGGPAALLAGAALGAVAGDALTPESPAVTYVVQNPVEPMTMGGEVIVGAGIPEGVELTPIPDTNFGYLNVNGLPVIVDTSDRQIVYIVRS